MRFFDHVKDKYRLIADDGPNSIDLSPGSASEENWQTSLQTGRTPEEVRDKAKELHEMLKCVEEMSLKSWDIFCLLNEGNGKHLEMHSPLLVKGLSREKLLQVAEILTKCAEYAHIK